MFPIFSCSAQKHQDNAVASEKHLADETVLVDWSSLLSIRQSRDLSPHLLHVLQDHVAMSVESLHTAQHLPVVAA